MRRTRRGIAKSAVAPVTVNPRLQAALQHIASQGPDAVTRVLEKALCEKSLARFIERSWPYFVPAKYCPNWHVDAISEHLEAVNRGQIRRLLVNIPPRFAKTTIVAVAWPIWTWIQNGLSGQYPLFGPQVRFLCVAYGSDKAQEDAVTSRRLLKSEWFRKHWGEVVSISPDRDSQERYDTTAGGSRISVGIGASVLGRGGDIKIIDDPSKPDEVESDVVRKTTIRSYDETLSSRENDPTTAAEVMIAQRLHDNDLPGHLLEKYGSDPSKGGVVHLNLPLEYDSSRHCVTVIGWEDPRGCDDNGDRLPKEAIEARDGMSLWPERFPKGVIAERKKAEGSYSFSAKYNQMPVPRGGGIIKPEWWKMWPPAGEVLDSEGKPAAPLAFPPIHYIVAYLDTALTEKTENDPSGMTIYGVWQGSEERSLPMNPDGSRRDDTFSQLQLESPRVMLMHAWTDWLSFPSYS